MLQNQPQKEQWNQEPIQSKLSLGQDFNNTSNTLKYSMTLSSTSLIDTKESKSSAHLHSNQRRQIQ
jgi:hypothetical protein